MLTTEALLALGDALTARRFEVSTHQLIAARRLLAELVEQGSAPPSPEDLAPYLSPIFCTNADQQEQFGPLYAEWLKAHYPVGCKDAGESPGGKEDRETVTRRRPWGPILALLSLVALSIAGLGWDRLRERQLSVRVVSDSQLMKEVEVQAAAIGYAGKTDEDGVVVVPYRQWDLPLALDASREGFIGATLRLTAIPSGVVTMRLKEATPPEKVEIVPKKKPKDARRLFVIPAEPDVVSPPQRSEVEMFHPWLLLPIISLPILLATLWWALAQLRRRGWLERLPGVTPDVVRRLRSEKAKPLRAVNSSLRALGRELRRRQSVASRTLDIPATLQATLKHGGFPEPIFRSRVEPEYVVLIDWASFSDHQALLAEEITQSLVEQDVTIDRFYFQGDPRHVWKPIKRPKSLDSEYEDTVVTSLQDVFGHFGERRLIVFSDGSAFVDPYTGSVSAIVGALKAWERPIVMTPLDDREWGRREWALSRAGLTVLPMSMLGFVLLGAVLALRGMGLPVRDDRRQRSQPVYQRDVNRLLDRVRPDAAFVGELISALQRDLDAESFTWLCACAVYPGVHWGITLRVGQCVVTDEARFARLLPGLARLPWLREGFFPDWLREALLETLPPAREHAVRATLGGFLRRIAEDANDNLPLRIAIPDEPSASVWKDILRGLKSTGKPKPRLDAADRDLVFLRFMSGRSSRLAVDPTEVIRNLFFKNGVPLVGVRLLPVAATSLLLAGALAWWLPLWTVEGSQTPPPDPIRQTPSALAMVPGQQWVVAGRSSGRVAVHALGTKRFETDAPDTRPVEQVTVAPDRFVALSRASVNSYIRSKETGAWSAEASPPTVKWATNELNVGANLLFDAVQDMAPAGDEALCVGFEPTRNLVVKVGRTFLARMVRADGPKSPAGPPTACAVSEGGQHLVVARKDHSIGVYSLKPAGALLGDVANGATLHDGSPLVGLATSDDGLTTIAVRGDGDLTLFRGKGRSMEALEGLGASGPITLSGDGKTFAFATRTGAVEAWTLGELGPRNVLLSIAVNEPADRVTRLRSPIPDAKAFADVLKRRYSYDVTALENPDKAQIKSLFDKAAEDIRAEDRVIVFLSGFGGIGVRNDDPKGWAFATGSSRKVDKIDGSVSVSSQELAEHVRRLSAREVLTILDVTDAGALLELKLSRAASGGGTRMLFASTATNQTRIGATGVSPFGRALFNVLATSNAGRLSGSSLRTQVAAGMVDDSNVEQTPVYGPFEAAGHRGGDFLLVPTGPIIPPIKDPRVAVPTDLSASERRHADEDRSGEQTERPVLPTAIEVFEIGDPGSYVDGQVFRNCSACPEMVVIPSGSFDMGAPKSEERSADDERPVHEVAVRRFALSKYEVTHNEWEACVSDGKCPPVSDSGYGRGRRPVIGVTFGDATRYVEWLSGKSKKLYRLPSEAEWEYAARARNAARWHFGNNPASICRYGKVGRCGKDMTDPVGSRTANGFGLYDMIGNVREWTEDCWQDWYVGAPRDGNAWMSGECSQRVVRGGSWRSDVQLTRSAYRYFINIATSHDDLGFRVARALP